MQLEEELCFELAFVDLGDLASDLLDHGEGALEDLDDIAPTFDFVAHHRHPALTSIRQ